MTNDRALISSSELLLIFTNVHFAELLFNKFLLGSIWSNDTNSAGRDSVLIQSFKYFKKTSALFSISHRPMETSMSRK